MDSKVYVRVIAEFTEEGEIFPLEVVWKDGRKFPVDRIRDIRRAASFRAGGAGVRYLCVFAGCERFLYLEETRWFVEVRPQKDETI